MNSTRNVSLVFRQVSELVLLRVGCWFSQLKELFPMLLTDKELSEGARGSVVRGCQLVEQ
jgi:hypothetical protein